MKEFFRTFLLLLQRNGKTLLVFEIAYRTAGYMLTLELVRAAVSYALKLGNYSNLTAENFLSFMQKPYTFLLFFVVSAVLLFLVTWEIAALLVCFWYSIEDRKVYISDLFIAGLRQTLKFIKMHPLLWVFFMGTAMPFLQLQFLIREVSYVKLLQYAARVLYEMVSNEWLLAAGLCFLLFVSYLCCFGLPFWLLEEKDGWQGLLRGWIINRKCFWKNLGGAVLLQGLVLILSVIIYLASMAAAVLWAMQGDTNEGIISSLLIYSDWVNMGLGLVSGALHTMLGSAFFFAVYRLWGRRMPINWREPEIPLPIFGKRGKRRMLAIVMTGIFLLEMSYVVYLAGKSRGISQDVLVGTQITAHRGGAKYAPENTLAALAYAKEHHADYAEVDVQETKDGILVLLHDENLKRTTGLKKNVWDTYYYQVQALDAGSYFKKEYQGEKIPTLREAIRFCGDELNLIIEIKFNRYNADIVQKVVDAVEDLGVEERVIICSMHYRFLEEVRQRNPKITTSYVMSVAYGDMRNLEAADCVSVQYGSINSRFVEKAHAAGKAVHAWTPNTRWQLERLQYCQVDNLITDVPASARQILNGDWAGSVDFWELMKYVL